MISYFLIPVALFVTGFWLGTAIVWFMADGADLGPWARVRRAFSWLPCYLRGVLS